MTGNGINMIPDLMMKEDGIIGRGFLERESLSRNLIGEYSRILQDLVHHISSIISEPSDDVMYLLIMCWITTPAKAQMRPPIVP